MSDRAQNASRSAKVGSGSHLEDREVILHQGLEGSGRLIISGMRLEHHAGKRLDAAAQCHRLGADIVDHLIWSNSTPGCTTRPITRPHAASTPWRAKALRCASMVACAASGVVTRKFLESLVRTARHRHFGADDVPRRLAAGTAPRGLGDLAQGGVAIRDQLIAERNAHRLRRTWSNPNGSCGSPRPRTLPPSPRPSAEPSTRAGAASNSDRDDRRPTLRGRAAGRRCLRVPAPARETSAGRMPV